MSADAPFASQADLEVAVGGANYLLELADFNGTGNIADAGVQSVIAGWLLDGAAEVRSHAEVKHDPETLANLDAGSLRRLIDANAVLSARVAHEKGSGGREMPAALRDRADRVDRFLVDLAEGRQRLGRVSGGKAAAINQPVGIVDFDPCQTGVSVGAFKLGFR